MRPFIISLLFCLAVLALIESNLRLYLFDHVSYSNSDTIDRQLRDRDASADWNILFVGDSETRWGIDPREIDRAFRARGIVTKTFNHAFDGFGASWWKVLLPAILDEKPLEHVEIVALGVQMTAAHQTRQSSERYCGRLQRPVLHSPFGKDLGFSRLCRDDLDWDTRLGQKIFDGLWIVRYSSAVRSLVLPSFMNENGDYRVPFAGNRYGEPINGFVRHRSISADVEDYETQLALWQAQFDPQRDFRPLDPDIWIELTSNGGLFDELAAIVEARGKQLILFALPTNPVLIDTFNRRQDYLRNSRLLSQWAADRNAVFLDAGIRDVPDNYDYFSDIRHLSGAGAARYSRELGGLLAQAILGGQ